MKITDRKHIEEFIIEKLVPTGISRIGLFGSFARGERTYHDIDILYDYSELPDTMAFLKAITELEEVIGPVDIVFERGKRNPGLQKLILAETIYIWPREGK